MKILIIGSRGFIGSHLLNHLLKREGAMVWGCDVVNDYVSNNYFVIDASNSDFEDVFQQQQFDFCINCSGAANVSDSLVHPLRDYYLNTHNIFRILEAIRKYSITCKFLNISSAAVYGNPSQLPIKEDAALQPVSPYGYHKLQAENICEEFYRFFNVKSCCVRVFSAYGNGLKKQLFWDVSQKLRTGFEVSLFGTGEESRDFIHIEDIVRAIEKIINNGSFEASCYNIANGNEITIRSAVQTLQALLETKSIISFAGNPREGDPLNWRADIGKLSALGYEQTVSIEDGLNKYVKWLREEKLV